MRAIQVVQVGVLGAAMLLSACGKDDEQTLASAKTYLQRGETREATIALKSTLQNNPASAEARFLLGQTLLDSGDAAGAEIELRRAQELAYSESLLAPTLARAMLGLQQYSKLVMQYGKLPQMDATAAADVMTSVAQAHLALGNADEAEASIELALSSMPRHGPATILRARMKAAAGDGPGALAVLDTLLAAAPTNVAAWQAKGDLLVTGPGDLSAAIEAYRKGLTLRTDSAALHGALIALHFAQNDRKAAQQQFEQMKKVLPAHGLTGYYEAQFAFADGQYARARELLQPVLEVTPDNASTLYIAGAIELQLNSLAQAEAHLSRAVSLQPGFPGPRRLLANVYLRGNQPAKASGVLRPLLDRPDTDAETLTLAGQAALLGNDARAADGYFALAAKLKPGDARTRTTLALAQLARGRGEAALAELQSVAGTDASVVADMAIISVRLRRGELDAALKAVDALELKQPESAAAAELRGRVHVQRKDAVAARKSFEQALLRDPKYLPAVSNLAALDFLQQQPDAARGRFEQLLKLDPTNVPALLALAELKRRTGGSSEDVAKLIGNAVSANPSDVQARMELVQHHLATGSAAASVAAAQAGVAAVGDSAALQDQLARVLITAGDMNQALAVFGKLAAQQPESLLGHLGLAEVNVAKGEFEAAARNLKRARQLDPYSLSAQRTSILVAMRQGRPQDAVAVARIMQDQRPQEAIGYIIEGEIEIDQKQWDAAVKAFRKALDKPTPMQAPARLHFALRKADKGAEAARFAETWLAQHPDDALFLISLGDAAAAQGDWPQAEKRFSQLVQRQPENPMALGKAAWSLMQQKKPGAVALAERAVKAAPGQPGLMDTLALALSGEKQHARAIEVQKRVVASAPDAPAFRLTLAKVYLESGDRRAARDELELVVKQGKEFSGRDEAVQLLKAVGGA